MSGAIGATGANGAAAATDGGTRLRTHQASRKTRHRHHLMTRPGIAHRPATHASCHAAVGIVDALMLALVVGMSGTTGYAELRAADDRVINGEREKGLRSPGPPTDVVGACSWGAPLPPAPASSRAWGPVLARPATQAPTP